MKKSVTISFKISSNLAEIMQYKVTVEFRFVSSSLPMNTHPLHCTCATIAKNIFRQCINYEERRVLGCDAAWFL
jgi:hypothetical protein